MALLKLYRGAAAPAAEVGKIWFDTTENVIKVCTAAPEGAEATWESYGLSNTDLAALVARVTTLEGDVKTINETTLPALKAELKKYADDAVAVETGRATDAEKALADRLDVIEGEAEGSIKKALADAKAYTDEAKAAVIGDATTAGDTLGKLEDRIKTIVTDAKTYSITKVTEGLVENVKEAYKLVDEDGTQVGETINIYKDSSLISVELTDANAEGVAGQYIKYTYVLANGTESVQYVDVSRLLVEAEFKNGLEVSAAGEVNVKVDAASEAFLTVGADGVKLAGVADAIATAVAAEAEIARAAEKANADAIAAEVARATAAEEAIAADLATLDAEVQEHEQVVSAALNDLNARMTTAEGSVDDHEARLSQAEADIDALEGALANKNVDAESTTPDYVTATAADNKVTVAATQKVIDAVALAETSVQTITSDNTCLTAVKTGNNVALSLVWEDGSF